MAWRSACMRAMHCRNTRTAVKGPRDHHACISVIAAVPSKNNDMCIGAGRCMGLLNLLRITRDRPPPRDVYYCVTTATRAYAWHGLSCIHIIDRSACGLVTAACDHRPCVGCDMCCARCDHMHACVCVVRVNNNRSMTCPCMHASSRGRGGSTCMHVVDVQFMSHQFTRT